MTEFQYDPLGRLASVTETNIVKLVEMECGVLGSVTRVASANPVLDCAGDGLNRAIRAGRSARCRF